VTRWYLDTSVALHAILPGGDPRARVWIDDARTRAETVVSSTLLQLEATRALRREKLATTLATPLVERIALASIDDGILRSAAAIEPHVRALDAIHLATCMTLGSGVVLVTHDTRMAEVARTLGYRTVDPLGA
jgi:predicted nucleic acid-binding protein